MMTFQVRYKICCVNLTLGSLAQPGPAGTVLWGMGSDAQPGQNQSHGVSEEGQVSGKQIPVQLQRRTPRAQHQLHLPGHPDLCIRGVQSGCEGLDWEGPEGIVCHQITVWPIKMAFRLIALYFFRSRTSSGVTLSCFMSSFIRSIHHFFGLPRGGFPSGLRRKALFAIDSSSLLTTWPYHRNRASCIFSIIGAPPMVFLTSSFFTWPHRVSPSIHLSIRISITWRACLSNDNCRGELV